MKVAAFSDVQANLPAMEVAAEEIISWRPDLVVMAGDLINRGPNSRGCLELFTELRQAYGWLPVRGNHEVWVLRCRREAPESAIAAQLRQFTDWTGQQIADLISSLADWPDHLCFPGSGDDSWVHVTHGTLAGNRDGISASVLDAELAGKLPSDIALFITAHTHKPLIRDLGKTRILNVGSVGSPFDGDPRGSYARIELRGGQWRTEIRRFAYDRARTERDFHDSGFLSEGGPLTRILHEEWRRTRLLMPSWVARFQPAVLAGEIGLDQAVERFLKEVD